MKNLKKDIRKSLVEAKKQKENRLIEAKIVQSRLLTLLESTPDFKNFKDLPFERQWEIGVPFMQEIAYLKQLGVDDTLINEQGIAEMLGKLFGTGISSGTEVVFEAMISSFLKKLGMEGFLADAITFFFVRNPKKIWESFGDCKAFSANVGQAITEAFIVKLQREYKAGGAGMDFVRNALMETLENSDFGQKLGEKFTSFVCNFFSNVKDKGTQVLNTINQPSQQPALATK